MFTLSEEIEPNEEGRVINVHVTKNDEGSDKEELERLKQLLVDLATHALEEKKEEVKAMVHRDEWDKVDSMSGFELEGYVAGLEKGRGKKFSSGVVRLKQFRGESPEFTEDEEGRRKWAEYILEARSDPSNPYHEQAKQLSREARSDKDLLKYLPRDIDFSRMLDPSLKDLPFNYTFKQKAEWDREQARKRAKNAK